MIDVQELEPVHEAMFHPDKEQFFANMDAQHLALTFDDVRLRTRHNHGNPLPDELDLTSQFSANVGLKVPFLSAAMTSVTEADMAVAMGKQGGIGVIHSAMEIDDQRRAVRRVKLDTNAVVNKPVTARADDTLHQVLSRCEQEGFDFRTIPVLDNEDVFVGIIGQRQFTFGREQMDQPLRDIMIPAEDVVSVPDAVGVDVAYKLMIEHGVNTLPIVPNGKLNGMYVFSDVDRIYHDHGQYNVDQITGQLLVAAAVSTGPDVYERVAEIRKYTDVVVIDTADGDADHVFTILERLKETYDDLDIVVGNISDGESAYELAEAGADGVKVGQGPGSICSTRRETGVGMPQVSAVWDCVKALRDKYPHIPICADGGISEHGDIPIAIGAGAHSVMMGRALAGTAESPGPILQRQDGSRYKEYWGMGSRKALQAGDASKHRYRSGSRKLILPEGIEGRVAYEGELGAVLGLCIAGLEKGMRYAKTRSIYDHRMNARFKRITSGGLRESHPHDIEVITK